MPGQVPGTGGGPVFQPRMPPPFTNPFDPGSTVPGVGADTSGVGAPRGLVASANTGDHTGGRQAAPEFIRLFSIAYNGPYAVRNATSFTVQVTPHSNDASAMSVQVETASDEIFSLEYVVSTLTSQASDVMTAVSVGPVDDNEFRWIRVRSGDGTLWSDWTSPVRILVDTRSGNVAEYMYENVGVHLTLNSNMVEYMYENVGVHLTLHPEAIDYMYEDVNTDQPYPRIWAIEPDTGRAGDGVKIYGMGFGATAGAFTGIVQMLVNGTWTTMSVTDWQRIAANSDAYNENRTLDPLTPHIDMEHNEVSFSIPSGSIPPGYPVRVRTVGP